MYQALYRKWRPRTFDDVVGQAHITETLRRQVETGHTSHAYLFTGTRGTGKTTCAKILARAVNCEHPEQGNPCNRCPACLGIENGSILDVLELDAASNNGVDQVRALRDEAVYTPAAVRKRVYIVDEVHMLSTPAFNALLKIMEEPPAHLMFILATTEVNKVPATIRSRCQQFSFRRIPAPAIAQRLSYVAGQEGIRLTESAAELLSRLADGGMRDALSLLDQCAGTRDEVDADAVLDTLGLAGAGETASLMEYIAAGDADGALSRFGRMYAGGKDAGGMLGELAGLIRDLLLRRTAPNGAADLLSGLFDEGTLRALGERFSTARLMQMLSALQQVNAALSRSADRRTDAELCLLRLCSPAADPSAAALSARMEQLEQRLDGGAVPAPVSAKKKDAPAAAAPTAKADTGPASAPAPETAPEPEAVPEKAPEPAPAPEAAPQPAPQVAAPEADFWPGFCAELKDVLAPGHFRQVTDSEKVAGTWSNGVLTLWVADEFTKSLIDRPAVTGPLARAAQARFGDQARVAFRVGRPPEQKVPAPAPAAEAAPEAGQPDALDSLLAFGKFDNIEIK